MVMVVKVNSVPIRFCFDRFAPVNCLIFVVMLIIKFS